MLLSLVLASSACARTAFTVANLPTYVDRVERVTDIAYGSLPSQRLDIYLPAHAAGRDVDVIVFLYGGRWTVGDKADYRFVGSAFAEKDFIVVIPDYRKYPQVRFPVFVQDAAKALAWVSDHIADYHGNPARVHVMGHSAGAHIGALLAADARYLEAEGKDRSLVIHNFAGLAGPYAFTPDEPDLEDMFGPPSRYASMQVPTFIDGHQPPMLLLYGDKDTAVKYKNLERLEQRIKEQGGCVHSIIYPGVSHTGILGALSWANLQGAPVVRDIQQFFGSSSRNSSCGT